MIKRRKPMAEETKQKISASKKGSVPWNKGKRGLQVAWNKGTRGVIKANSGSFTSESLVEKWKKPEYKKNVSKKISVALKGVPKSEKHKQALRNVPRPSGEDSPSWKGGKKEDRKHGKLIEYRTWRANIFSRDDFTCGLCNKQGGKIQAHHIKKWSDYPELRYELFNGVTLCILCHNKTKFHEEEYEVEFSNKLGTAT